MDIISVEDISVLVLGGIVMYMMEKEPGNKETRVVEKRRQYRQYEKGGDTSLNLDIIRKKEIALVERGVPLPTIPPNDPGSYSAELDLLLRESNGSTIIYKPSTELLGYGLPHANKKAATALFHRAGRMSGLNVPLLSEEDEANWVR